MLRSRRFLGRGAAPAIPAAVAALVALAAACEPTPEAKPPATPPPAAPAPPPVVTATAPAPRSRIALQSSMESAGLDSTALDRSVDPCKDFYQFACGGWLSRTEIPADKPAWSRSFSVIADHNEAALHKILEDAAHAGKDADPVTKKIGAYYGACMDERAIEGAKGKPLKPLLDLVKKVTDEKSLSAVVTELHRHEIWALFDISDTQDAKDATRVIAEIDQSGLGMPDRDYYVKEDAKSKELRVKYAEHVHRTMKLAGWSEKDAKQATADVMRIETELAKASKTRVERREPTTMYNRLDRAGVAAAAPRFLWSEYFKGIGFPDLKEITVTAPKFLEEVNTLVAQEKAPAWRNYLAWTVVRALTPSLSKAFVDEGFAFEAGDHRAEGAARPLEALRRRHRRGRGRARRPALRQGQLLPREQAGDRALRPRDSRRPSATSWRSSTGWTPPPRPAPPRSSRPLAYLIGYPKKWKSYDFDIKPKAYLENALAARAWHFGQQLAKVGKPLDREEWHMTPPTVNAYYNAQMNHMVFPAGILQPPFFNPRASVPVNLGGMGMVVGHELTHGFDDKGAKFDAKGNLANWWSDQDKARFKAKTDCISDQYSQLRGAARGQAQRPAHPGGEHRGRRRRQARVRRVPGHAPGRHLHGGRRRLHRGPAVLPRHRPGLVLQAKRRAGARPRPDRSPLGRSLPRQRPALQLARVRRRVLLRRGHAHAPPQRLRRVVSVVSGAPAVWYI